MTFAYDYERLNSFLERILQKNLGMEAWKWLSKEGQLVRTAGDITKFNIAFVAMPRRTGKSPVWLSADEAAELRKYRRDLDIGGWTADRLSRVWLLMQPDAEDKGKYIGVIENLFMNAEMSELVALYSSLPVLAYPDAWVRRCAEGIRSNIGQVLEAVICRNPYPSEQLDEAAWNQLVLKAIFTDKPVLEIIGIKTRANERLAKSLSDYAHERWAAGRPVNPLLWICVAPFIDEGNFSDIQRIFGSENLPDRHAAALVCYESDYAPARGLLEKAPELKARLASGEINWRALAEAVKN